MLWDPQDRVRSALSILNATFSLNVAGTFGGAIRNNNGGSITLVTSLFDGNHSLGSDNGTAINSFGGTLTIDELTTFINHDGIAVFPA
ncbi:hypothetical protein Mal15_35670 [Stieleria maiorica]|uniref:Uncharacterized protein n=1 Tax=Stieleria maiorica TaxID=2795974 RepID=A0A5B9ME10_9BACT|nr:hypothetical protein [Stieleria maiorica]QEF99502.1 hypothetical protein Mal15_35670 [Stieleria maiorica]